MVYSAFTDKGGSKAIGSSMAARISDSKSIEGALWPQGPRESVVGVYGSS